MTDLSSARLLPGSQPFFSGWPTLCLRANGELIAVASGQRTRHVCPFGRVQLWRSADEGETWSGPQVLSSGPLDDRDAGVVETASGALVVTWFSSVAYERILDSEGRPTEFTEEEEARWKAIRASIDDETRVCELGAWSIRSDDGGKTWSEKVSTRVGNPHGPIQLKDGRLLMIGNLLAEGTIGFHGSPYLGGMGIAESVDDGRSWQWVAEMELGDAYPVDELHEPHMIEAADGRLVAHFRNHYAERDLYELLQTESFDGGKRWTPLHTTGVWGYPAHLMRLRDGRLLSTYSYRKEPRSNRAVVSSDHGESWSEPITISEAVWGDFGYPSTVELANGDLVTLWYGQVLAPYEGLPGNDWLARIWLQRWRLG